MKRTVAALALVGFLPHAALAGDGASPTLSERASNTWTTMGLGMHIMLGKVGIGDMADKPDAAGADVARALVDKQVASAAPQPAVMVASHPAQGWAGWMSDKAYDAGLGSARAADALYGYAYRGSVAAAPYAGQAWGWTRDAGTGAWEWTKQGAAASAPYAGIAWDATRRMGAAGYALTADGVRAGVDNLPVVIDWTADFAAAGATSFISVGGSTLACGIATTPPAAVSAGAAYLVCIPVVAAGGWGGMQALRGVYDLYGRTPSESAFVMGSFAGGLAGGLMGNKGVIEFAQWRLRSQYGDFQTYSKAARALSERNIRAWDPKVRDMRDQGFHVDHIQSIKCGWTHGVSVGAIAAARNFQYLTARENLSLGAKGC